MQSDKQQQTCLITGGTGFIGSHLINILGDEYQLYLASRKSFQSQRSNTSVIQVDLTANHFEAQFPKKLDYIIHLAQSEHYKRFPEMSKDIFDVNIRSSFNLLEYARKSEVKTVVIASSGIVYGHGHHSFNENQNLTLDSFKHGFYYTSKLCTEAIAENYANDMNIILLRFFFVYGPRQKKTMLIPSLMQSIIDKRHLILQGESGIKINPIFVSEAAKAIKLSLRLEGLHKINVAGPEVLTIKEIGNLIGKNIGIDALFKVNEVESPNHIVGCIKNMSKLLLVPKISFEAGIKHILSSDDKISV